MAHSLETLPPLDTLRAFEAAARAGSFSAAASVLNLTHGAISRRIARLEGWLGLRVFERQARGIALTPEGQRLFQRTQEAFALIADTSDRWSEPRGPAVVRVNSMPSVCSLWLMPRVARFEAGDPPLRVILLIDQRTVDLSDMGVDLAIRCGRGGLPGRISVKLFEEWCFPIAAPDLAKRIGTGDPERLLSAPLIHDSDASGWRTWFAAYNLVLDAAACGLGIALARPPLAHGPMETGRLVQVDQRTVLNPVSYWLDRPIGTIRGAAATLARRVAEEAGMSPDVLAGFLKTDRK
jgi:LysR family transcriptional regulator, glycine cleavage system transcriptional activator